MKSKLSPKALWRRQEITANACRILNKLRSQDPPKKSVPTYAELVEKAYGGRYKGKVV